MSDETEPLLQEHKARKSGRGPNIVSRILFCVFIISLSVAFTWVPYAPNRRHV